MFRAVRLAIRRQATTCNKVLGRRWQQTTTTTTAAPGGIKPSSTKPSTPGLTFHPSHQPRNEHFLKQAAALLGVLTVPAAVFVYSQYHTEQVPLSSRKRIMWLPKVMQEIVEEVVSDGIEEQYAGLLLPQNHPFVIDVVKICQRLVTATGDLGAGYDWQVFVVDVPLVNAVCLPGGKIIVFTGIVQVCPTEAELAVVLAHEIGHAIAKHNVELLGRQVIHVAGMMLVALSLGFQLYSMSTWTTEKLKRFLFDLPFSQAMETEADYIGLMIMAKACYDPAIAPLVLENLGSGVTEETRYFSTHPPDAERASNCRHWMPQAVEIRSRECPRATWTTLLFRALASPFLVSYRDPTHHFLAPVARREAIDEGCGGDPPP